MSTGRWRLEMVEELERLPVRWHPPGRTLEIRQDSHQTAEAAKAALVAALQRLARRGTGPLAWATSFRQDPIAFVLDSMSDAVNLWGSTGKLLYRNRAAERLPPGRYQETAHEMLTSGAQRFERRCSRFRCGNAEYLLEIIGRRLE